MRSEVGPVVLMVQPRFHFRVTGRVRYLATAEQLARRISAATRGWKHEGVEMVVEQVMESVRNTEHEFRKLVVNKTRKRKRKNRALRTKFCGVLLLRPTTKMLRKHIAAEWSLKDKPKQLAKATVASLYKWS